MRAVPEPTDGGAAAREVHTDHAVPVYGRTRPGHIPAGRRDQPQKYALSG